MPLFSQRMGFKPLKKETQIESLDSFTRNKLWDALTSIYFYNPNPSDLFSQYTEEMRNLIWIIWTSFFKNRKDKFDQYIVSWIALLESKLWSWNWYEVFDFLEFIVKNFEVEDTNLKFIEYCNKVFSEESVPYRFVGKEIIPLTNEVEIEEIEKAIGNPYDPIQMHLEKALNHFSDRVNPDYPNSIKESISAVEAICQIIVGQRGVVLNRALGRLEDAGVQINEELKKGFRELYGWTSSDSGIRHAMMDLPSVDQDDARFMLVTCSAFVNYLIAEASKAGIDLQANYQTIKVN